MTFKPLKLAQDEYVIAVVPAFASGPGWANRPLWVYIANSSNKLRSECIQPEDQTAEMHFLFAPGAAMCVALKNSVATKKEKLKTAPPAPNEGVSHE